VAIVESLAENPLSRSLGVFPLKYGQSMYTVRFDDALLVFQILADYPLVQLIHIAWNVPPNGGGPVEAPGRLG